MAQTDLLDDRRARRRVYERLWIVGVVAFTAARFVVAYSTLRTYDLNIWLFGFIDIITAVPYGVSTARLAVAVVDRSYNSAAQWVVVAAVTFLAPYAYIALAGEEMPVIVYIVLAILVLAMGTNAILGVRRKVAELRDGTED
jgi:hypothetical protein